MWLKLAEYIIITLSSTSSDSDYAENGSHVIVDVEDIAQNPMATNDYIR